MCNADTPMLGLIKYILFINIYLLFRLNEHLSMILLRSPNDTALEVKVKSIDPFVKGMTFIYVPSSRDNDGACSLLKARLKSKG